MSFRRVGGLCAVALATILWVSCGEVYRPVVIPVNSTPPNPANFHEVFGISSNIPSNLGSALQIDVSGDTNIGAASMGVNPTHGLITPNFARVLIASAGSLYPGGSDVVTSFTPATAGSTGTGLGTPTTFTYPNFGPNLGGAPQWSCSYLPDFVATTQTAVAFVANYGVDGDPNCAANLASTDSVSVLSIATTTIGLISYLPAGSHPVALAETANAQNLYVVNQGNGTVQDMSPLDLSLIGAPIPVGNTPVWAVARPDNQRVFVLTQGDGTLVTIDTATNTVLNTQSVGAGANFLLFDQHLNRLYVTNPVSGTVFVFAATGGANDTPVLLSSISMTAGSNPPCASACSPVSVAALQDGSRFYVASYQNQTSCTDPIVGSGSACVVPMLTVFDALSMTPKAPTSTLLTGSSSISLLMGPQFATTPTTQFAVPAATACIPAATYAPGTTRFRMFAVSASDNSHVYVSICDAGTIADVNTTTNSISTGSNTPDTLVTDIVTPFSAGAAGSNNEPPPQNPIFLFSGQ
jgi:YVTN family beta-propeller protein